MVVDHAVLETLYRIDERTANLARSLDEVKGEMNAMKSTVESNYVTHTEFEPIKRVILGLVGLTLVSVFTAIVAVVLKQTH